MNQAIIEFKIVYACQKPSYKKRPISEFYTFESQLLWRLPTIRMIVFYFNTAHFIYPYGIHPIILQRNNDRFDVFFYHYYTVDNRRAELTVEQQKMDYDGLQYFLTGSALWPLIRSPFLT